VQVRLEFLDGRREGQVAVLDVPYATLGRHPLCTVAFDGEDDLDVSSRHAAVFRDGDLFILRDLGSTNGTFVNGHRLRDDHILSHEDRIQFGQTGPRLRVTLAAGRTPAARTSPAHYSPLPPRRTQEDEDRLGPVAPDAPGAGPATRIREEVARQTAGFRRALWSLSILTIALVGTVLWQRWHTATRLTTERSLLLSRVDSLTTRIATMSVDVRSLRTALDSAQRETDRIRARLTSGETTPGEVERLSRELQATLDRQEQMLTAAAMDLVDVVEDNADAIAVVIARWPDGTSYTGTGFAIHTTEESGYVLTNAHVVGTDQATQATDVGVVFNRSTQHFRAEVAARHPNQDLVLLRVPIRGGVPIVKHLGWGRQPTAGHPVAVLGFPLGLDLEMGGDWQAVGVSATMLLGTVTRVVPNLIQLDGYGAQGSSGSPVLDQDGAVIAVVYGGEPETAGRVIYAIPIGASLQLLDAVLGP